jgi:hypothetical protein
MLRIRNQALFSILVVAFIAITASRPFQHNPTGEQGQGSSKSEQKATETRPSGVHQPANGTERDSSKNKPDSQNEAPWITKDLSRDALYVVYVVATIALVIVGIVGVRAAYKTIGQIGSQIEAMRQQGETAKQQLEVMGRQTNAVEKQLHVLEEQIRLQSAAMCQWLILRDWDYSCLERANKDASLQVRLNVINGTKFPVRLLGYKFTINGQVAVTEGEALSHTLVPEEVIPVRLWAPLTTEQLDDIRTSGLTVRISGWIGFIDVLKNRQDQTATGLLECRRGQTTFTPEISSIDPQQDE